MLIDLSTSSEDDQDVQEAVFFFNIQESQHKSLGYTFFFCSESGPDVYVHILFLIQGMNGGLSLCVSNAENRVYALEDDMAFVRLVHKMLLPNDYGHKCKTEYHRV